LSWSLQLILKSRFLLFAGFFVLNGLIQLSEADAKIVRGLFADTTVLNDSLEELVAAADLNKDGFLQEEEYLAFLDDHVNKKKKKKKPLISLT
jgi:hypothetical protein